MGVLDCYLIFLTVIHFHSIDILGYENKCECGTIRKALTKEIFDLKFENSMLTSRIEQIESVLKGDPSVAGLVSSADNGRLQALENKVSTIEVKLQDRGEFSRGSVELNSLIARTMRSEKKKRLQTELKVENGLKKINESFKVINAQIDARFDSYQNTISDQIEEYKNRLTGNVSQVENTVHTIYATVANVENRTEKLIESEISTLQTDIETISKDVSRMDDDISSVIDIVLLDQKATCTPNCTNGGVCFKGNNCRCKHLTGGGRCENFICEDECFENGGECVGPGECKCSEGRSGRNCESILCPELASIQHGRIFQDTSDGIRNNYESVAEYTCINTCYLLNGNKQSYTRKCQADGSWTGEQPYCEISVPRCERITQFYGGNVTYFGDRQRWSLAIYICDEAYSLIPSNVEFSKCTDNLNWEPSPPQCLQKAKVEKPDHSYVRGTRDVLLHGESYKLYCYRGYQLYRDGFLQKRYETIRNNNGTFVPQVPKCEQEILE